MCIEGPVMSAITLHFTPSQVLILSFFFSVALKSHVVSGIGFVTWTYLSNSVELGMLACEGSCAKCCRCAPHLPKAGVWGFSFPIPSSLFVLLAWPVKKLLSMCLGLGGGELTPIVPGDLSLSSSAPRVVEQLILPSSPRLRSLAVVARGGSAFSNCFDVILVAAAVDNSRRWV